MDDTSEAKPKSDIDMSHRRLPGQMLCAHSNYPLECLLCLRAEIAALRQMVTEETVARGEAEATWKVQVSRLAGERSVADATIRSVSFMLGWKNVPPRNALEMTISSNRKRLENAEAEVTRLTGELTRAGQLRALAGAEGTKRLVDALEGIRRYVREVQPNLGSRVEFNGAFRVLNESAAHAATTGELGEGRLRITIPPGNPADPKTPAFDVNWLPMRRVTVARKDMARMFPDGKAEPIKFIKVVRAPK